MHKWISGWTPALSPRIKFYQFASWSPVSPYFAVTYFINIYDELIPLIEKTGTITGLDRQTKDVIEKATKTHGLDQETVDALRKIHAAVQDTTDKEGNVRTLLIFMGEPLPRSRIKEKLPCLGTHHPVSSHPSIHLLDCSLTLFLLSFNSNRE